MIRLQSFPWYSVELDNSFALTAIRKLQSNSTIQFFFRSATNLSSRGEFDEAMVLAGVVAK